MASVRVYQKKEIRLDRLNFHQTQMFKLGTVGVAAVRNRLAAAQELLATVRAQVLQTSVYVRDALLDPKPVTADYRRQIEDAYAVVDRALSQYVPGDRNTSPTASRRTLKSR